jgi:hypothetical protein
MDGDSIAAYNLFWNNGTDHQSSNVDLGTTLFTDPLLDAKHHLLPGSPAIDAGTAHFEWQGETVLDLPSSAYKGAAPDLGWFESDFGPSNQPPTVVITAPADGSTFIEGESIDFSGTATDAEDGDLAAGLSWMSSLDGVIGMGGSFSRDDLSLGTHTITSTVSDSGWLVGSDQISIGVTSPSGNLPPVVSAGPDQAIGLFDDAILDATVTDDGLPNPPGSVTTTWTQVSGAGAVSFADATVVDTTASLPESGTYVLRLTAYDGELSASDELTITVAYRFVSWGDTKHTLTQLASLSNQAALLDPSFTVFAGDLESDGFTLSGMNAWKDAMNGYSDNGMFDKTLPVRGNHDQNDTAGWQSYYDMHATAQGLGASNYSALDEDLTYSFDYGNSHFIGVDVLGGASALTPEQVSWIDNDLSAAEMRGLTHAFVYFHGPIYCLDGHCTCTTRICPLSPIVMSLIEVFNNHPIVSATFHGHEHTHAYVHIDDTRIPEATHPFEQFVTGSAGAGPSDCIPGRTDYCLPSDGFATVDVSGSSFTVSF